MYVALLPRAAALLSFALFLGGVSAQAAPFQARIGARTLAGPHGVIALVSVNDQPVATLHTGAGGLGPAQRALVVKQQLTTLVAAGLTAKEIAVVSRGREGWAVLGRGQALLTVTPREASAQRQSSRHLAQVWAASLKRLLSEPALTVSARQFLLPFGSTQVIAVGGASPAQDISISGGDSHVAAVAYNTERRRLTVHGIGTGTAQISVSSGESALPITVTVKKYAAFVQPHVIVRVTGRPSAPVSLVQTAIYFGLKRALNATAGAQVRLLQAPKTARSLRPGGSLDRRVEVRVAGPDLLPVIAAPLITVVNQPLVAVPAVALYYSNNPEQVRDEQTLFTAPLSPGRPIRLDYHHQNSSGKPLIFHSDVVNVSDKTLSVFLMDGVAQPEVDTVQIGQRAGAAFLQALDSGTGLVLEVPPHARIPLVVQPFSPRLTVSGILEVQQIGGADGGLSLTVAADDDRETLASSPLNLAQAIEQTDGANARLVSAPAAPLTYQIIQATSPYVFGAPRVMLDGVYAVGGQWAHLRLGNAESLRNAAGTQTLWGNYGVSYLITLHLTNPTAQARTVLVIFAPEAGLAAGVFQIPGQKLLQFSPMPPPVEEEVTRVRLQPGESKTVSVRTILLNGSAYPASLVVHAL
ncbi:MAG: hypothetical protein ACRYFS_08260 [Janthinobacterium lividum]